MGENARNIKLTVAYEGTAYHGYQSQGASIPTIQWVLEAAWLKLTGQAVRMIGAGRTDAGVHADGQVVNFHTVSDTIPSDRIAAALNSALPRDIRVIGSSRVDAAFHAQYDAVSKRYTYRLLNRPFPLPRHRHDTLFVPASLDVTAMNEAANMLVGRHDFVAMTRRSELTGNTLRHMFACEVSRVGPIVKISMEADGFLYHMVRTIAGTLIPIGEGRRPPGWMKEVLLSKDRTKAGRTLPGRGLVLEYVTYGK